MSYLWGSWFARLCADGIVEKAPNSRILFEDEEKGNITHSSFSNRGLSLDTVEYSLHLL
jgi:hypothetical protein